METLSQVNTTFIKNRESILTQWLSYDESASILELHGIDKKYFMSKYASGIFDYFMGVVSGDVAIGNSPIMQELLTYFKKRELSADELFEICSHFKRAMVDFSYDAELNSKELFDEISYIFDKNFKGILKFYTDTMFQKLIDAREDALSATQAKEHFLSNMSHEIRTPLNAILGFVNLLIDEDITPKQRNYLDIIHRSGENLLGIINDVLDFSKLRSGEFAIEEKYFSIDDELSHTIELFVASANIKSITLSAFLDPRIPSELYGDALRVKQIVSNFLSNAIKFTPEDGLIEVEAFYREGNLEISVQDSGRGISSLDREHIFKAFAQAEHGDESEEGGTGLGLSISHQLAQKMSGKIELISDLGHGSTFTLKVPLKASALQNPFFDNVEEFQKLKMVLYSKNKKLSYIHNAFLRYANVFEMDVTLVDNIEDSFDVCIFVDEESSVELKEALQKSDKKFIVLMAKESDSYENFDNISSAALPLFYSKLFVAFNKLLDKSSVKNPEQSMLKKFSGNILVAEDNEANQELIKILLLKYGLSFDIAVNGEEAFKLYTENNYDLILMDEQMPILSGEESTQKIIEYEKQNSKPHTPISALTANVVKDAQERGVLSGFDAFLGKPLVLKDLERIFALYLKEVVELDIKKLTKELILSETELLMLLKLFMKKMQSTLGELEMAIQEKDMKKIRLLAHSIKGSSGNFRIKSLQNLSSEMENRAKSQDKLFEYHKIFEQIKKVLASIEVL